jgi:hypothetical protein
MFQKRVLLCTCATVLAVAVACSKQSPTPVSPSPSPETGVEAAPDGSTLKVTAPTLVSPINGAQPDIVVLTATKAVAKFTDITPSYEFEIFNAANTRVYTSGVTGGVGSGNNVTHQPSVALDFDQPFTWRVRAVFQGAAGPWSASGNFRSAAGGYIRGNELFDPLTNGPSKIINASRDVTWLPGVGVRLNSKDSYVEWRITTACPDCEYSAMMTNIGNGSEEWKTKVMSMLREDGVDTTINPYRVTIDKRSTWLDQGSRVRYTMRSRGREPAAEVRGGFQTWNRAQTYFWHFEWRGGMSRLIVRDGGRNGNVKENLSHDYPAPYNPTPHLVRLGSVGGRAENETNPGTIVWNVWFGPNARPALPGDK